MRTVLVVEVFLLLQYNLAANINTTWISLIKSVVGNGDCKDSLATLEQNFLVPVVFDNQNSYHQSNQFFRKSDGSSSMEEEESEHKSLEKTYAKLRVSSKRKIFPVKEQNSCRSPIQKPMIAHKNRININQYPKEECSPSIPNALTINELKKIAIAREESEEQRTAQNMLAGRIKESIDERLLAEKINRLTLSYMPEKVSQRIYMVLEPYCVAVTDKKNKVLF